MLNIPLDDKSRSFWESLYAWKTKFRFLAYTGPTSPAHVLLDNPHKQFGRWRRVVTPTADNAIWCFATAEARAAFLTLYPEAQTWKEL
jgi:hypothetical protein